MTQGPSRAHRAVVWLLVLSPLAIVPSGLDAYLMPTLAVMGVGLVLAAWSPGHGALPPAVTWGAVAIAVTIVAVGVVHQQGIITLTGRWPRYEGLVMMALVVALLWAGARAIDLRSAEARTLLTRVTAVLATAVGGLLILQHMGWDPLGTSVTRPGSFLGNATDAALVCAVAAVWLISHQVSASRAAATFPRVAIAVSLVAIVLAGSRAVALALAVGIAAWATVVGLSQPAVRGRTWSVAGATGGLLLALAVVMPQLRDRVTGYDAVARSTVEGRRIMWSDTWQMVLDNPWWGTGIGSYRDAMTPYHSEEWALSVGFENPPDDPHLWPLALASTGGFLLLAVTVIVLAAVAWTWWRHLPRPLPGWAAGVIGMVAVYGLTIMTHPPSVLTLVPLAFVAGGALRVTSPTVPSAMPTAARRWLAVPLLGLLTVTAVVATAGEVALRTGVERAAEANPTQASAAFESAQRLRWWDSDVSVQAAHALATTALAGRGDAEVAVQWSERALNRVPDSHDARRAAAWAYEAGGDLDSALHHWDWLVDRSPRDPSHRLGRAIVRATLGDLQGAESDLLFAAEYAPNSAAPWENLAVVYRLMGDSAAEQRALDQARARSAPTNV